MFGVRILNPPVIGTVAVKVMVVGWPGLDGGRCGGGRIVCIVRGGGGVLIM